MPILHALQLGCQCWVWSRWMVFELKSADCLACFDWRYQQSSLLMSMGSNLTASEIIFILPSPSRQLLFLFHWVSSGGIVIRTLDFLSESSRC
jgi:hypothetical protein